MNQVSIPIVGTGGSRLHNFQSSHNNPIQPRNFTNPGSSSGALGITSTTTTLAVENIRLKEKLSQMGHIVMELQSKVDSLTSSPSLFKKLKLYVDDLQVPAVDSKGVVSQYLDLQVIGIPIHASYVIWLILWVA